MLLLNVIASLLMLVGWPSAVWMWCKSVWSEKLRELYTQSLSKHTRLMFNIECSTRSTFLVYLKHNNFWLNKWPKMDSSWRSSGGGGGLKSTSKEPDFPNDNVGGVEESEKKKSVIKRQKKKWKKSNDTLNLLSLARSLATHVPHWSLFSLFFLNASTVHSSLSLWRESRPNTQQIAFGIQFDLFSIHYRQREKVRRLCTACRVDLSCKTSFLNFSLVSMWALANRTTVHRM